MDGWRAASLQDVCRMRRVSSAGVAACGSRRLIFVVRCLWSVGNTIVLLASRPGPFETRSWGPAFLLAAVTQGAQLHTCVLPWCIAHFAPMVEQCFMLFTTASGCATAQFCDIFVHVLQPHYLAVQAAVATWRVPPQGHLLLFDCNRPSRRVLAWPLVCGLSALVLRTAVCTPASMLMRCVLLLCSSAGLPSLTLTCDVAPAGSCCGFCDFLGLWAQLAQLDRVVVWQVPSYLCLQSICYAGCCCFVLLHVVGHVAPAWPRTGPLWTLLQSGGCAWQWHESLWGPGCR